ncbi:MAG TPA: EAL domain-containing protein [Thermoanaerobaculia bacterium]|nr:EAL domain-containing protein [Thermoanaerobaculia bacterium]
MTISPIAALTGNAVGAFVIALLFLAFLFRYRGAYLRPWAFFWIATTLHHAASALTLHLRASSQSGAVLAGCAAGAFGWAALGWLLLGCHELAFRRPARPLPRSILVPALAATGAVAGALLLLMTSRNEPFLSLSTQGPIAAVVAILAARWLWREGGRRNLLGFNLMVVALAVYAAVQMHATSVVVELMTGGSSWRLGLLVPFLDFYLQAMLAVGMASSILEDERETARLATIAIERLAYHDALTGLPNRPLFMDRLIMATALAERTKQQIAVFFLDLDRFKDINDSLGHTAGDMLLKGVAERIRGCVRQSDTLARFGGDEFTILVQRLEKVEYAAKVAQKILEVIRIPFLIGERELFVTTSIGISIYPHDGLDAETLVKHADIAMYRAKERGRDDYELYTAAMNQHALERIALEGMLRKAIGSDELILHYQPIIDLHTHRLVSVEALIRWNHPTLGLIAPAHFISVAELSGLIIPIGKWVLSEACRQARAWKGKTGRDIRVSINLSARQFQQTDLLTMVRTTLERTGLEPHLLEIEITESSAMSNADLAIRTLLDLKSLGVRIAMDDFGTGYSSLSYLKRFPIDCLKLDQSFVRDIVTDEGDAAIIGAVVAMAHILGIEVVAEGVETEEQFRLLAAKSCDRIQGFLFSHPLPAERLEQLLLADPTWFLPSASAERVRSIET